MEASTCVFHRGQNQLNAVAYLGNSTTSVMALALVVTPASSGGSLGVRDAAHERTVAGASTPSDGRFLKYRRCQLHRRCSHKKHKHLRKQRASFQELITE